VTTISEEQVRHVAKLARLALTDEEITLFQKQLSDILTYVETLNRLDTSGVDPTSHVLDIRNVLRKDAVRPSLSAEEAVANAPDRRDGFFRVPKIIE
jgi:aspartyl-tRNA(Asn)/glutamyl-tRNA(Gln) amidotransferase subunit C